MDMACGRVTMRMVGGRYGSTFTGLTAEAVLGVMFFNLQLEVIGSISLHPMVTT